MRVQRTSEEKRLHVNRLQKIRKQRAKQTPKALLAEDLWLLNSVITRMRAKLKRRDLATRQKRPPRFEQVWLVTGKTESIRARQRARILARDLTLLDQVIKSIKSKLLFPEKNRTAAREFWRANSERLNEARRKKTPRNPCSLERAYRGLFESRQEELERAARRMLAPKQSRYTPEERKLVRALHRRFHKAKGARESSPFIFALCGISIRGLREHLESLFKPGMAWENYGIAGWVIDHKRPCASFNLADPEQQKVCFHYTNLQPLWAKENAAKGAKMPVDIAERAAHIVPAR